MLSIDTVGRRACSCVVLVYVMLIRLILNLEFNLHHIEKINLVHFGAQLTAIKYSFNFEMTKN